MDFKVLVEYTVKNLIDEEDLQKEFGGDVKKCLENTGEQVFALAEDPGIIYGIRKIK